MTNLQMIFFSIWHCKTNILLYFSNHMLRLNKLELQNHIVVELHDVKMYCEDCFLTKVYCWINNGLLLIHTTLDIS